MTWTQTYFTLTVIEKYIFISKAPCVIPVQVGDVRNHRSIDRIPDLECRSIGGSDPLAVNVGLVPKDGGHGSDIWKPETV